MVPLLHGVCVLELYSCLKRAVRLEFVVGVSVRVRVERGFEGVLEVEAEAVVGVGVREDCVYLTSKNNMLVMHKGVLTSWQSDNI